MMKLDGLFEKCSSFLPFGLGKAHYRAIAENIDKTAATCIDIGCGRGAFKFLQKYKSVGCDIYHPVLQKAREKGYYSDMAQCDIRALPFSAKSFDVAVCVEVIEHLHKEEGMRFLKQLEAIARRQVIITTPWGYFPIVERKDNPNLSHLSGWLPEEFEAMGYKVTPFYYPRYPMGSHVHQILARFVLAPVMYPLVRMYPDRFALDFIAVKKLS